MNECKWCFFLLTLLMAISFIQSQVFQSLIILENPGTDFIPANAVELITTYTDIPTLMSCFNKCNMNSLCRTFVIDITWPFICRLYQGSVDTGSVIASLSSTSRVAGLRYDSSLYLTYNQECDPNLPPFDRYLTCINQSWNCPMATYWNGSMCVNQVYDQASCDKNQVCREDIGLICSLLCNKCVHHSTIFWNSTSCASSICPTLLPTDSSLLSLWLLDDDAHDLMNKYNGTVFGSPSYTTGYIGRAIQFSNDGLIFMSHIDFYRRSFTIEMWFSLTNTSNPKMALFSECTSAIDNQCLHIETDGILGFRMGFWYDDIDVPAALVANQWYHVAFVYDYNLRQRLTYLNGISKSIIETYPDASHLYLGQSGNAIIGGIEIAYDGFVGNIDHVSITYRVKEANEILDDATLVAYYTFDCGLTLDSGPNLLHGFANASLIVTGAVNQGIAFNSLTAYFQAPGFTALGTTNQSFSISLWIKPLNLNGTLIHLSTTSTGNGSCTSILGFSVSGNIIARLLTTDVYGPILAINVWTHITYTFSVTNGISLYINGTLQAFSGSSMTRDGSNVPFYVTVANQLSGAGSCTSGNISNIPYTGAIDELRIYNREITAFEVSILSS